LGRPEVTRSDGAREGDERISSGYLGVIVKVFYPFLPLYRELRRVELEHRSRLDLIQDCLQSLDQAQLDVDNG